MGMFDQITAKKMVEINATRYKVKTDKPEVNVLMVSKEVLDAYDENNVYLRMPNIAKKIDKEEGHESEYVAKNIINVTHTRRFKKDGTPDLRFKIITKENE